MKLKHCIFFLLLLPSLLFAEDANDLFAAAVTGKLERTEALLGQGVDVNSKTESGRTALMGASFSGNLRVVKALLAYGADVNLADHAGTTALMDALVFGHEDIVNLLITAGADVNAADKQNLTVMAKAKKTGLDNLVKILEKAGAKEEGDLPIEEAPAAAQGGEGPAEVPPAENPEQKN